MIVLACAVAWLYLRAPDAPPTSSRLTDIESKIDSLFKLRLEWQTVLEQIEDSLETIERKRRRAAASASKGSPPAELAGLLEAAGLAQAPTGDAAPVAASSIGSRSQTGGLMALRARARAAGRL